MVHEMVAGRFHAAWPSHATASARKFSGDGVLLRPRLCGDANGTADHQDVRRYIVKQHDALWTGPVWLTRVCSPRWFRQLARWTDFLLRPYMTRPPRYPLHDLLGELKTMPMTNRSWRSSISIEKVGGQPCRATVWLAAPTCTAPAHTCHSHRRRLRPP